MKVGACAGASEARPTVLQTSAALYKNEAIILQIYCVAAEAAAAAAVVAEIMILYCVLCERRDNAYTQCPESLSHRRRRRAISPKF